MGNGAKLQNKQNAQAAWWQTWETQQVILAVGLLGVVGLAVCTLLRGFADDPLGDRAFVFVGFFLLWGGGAAFLWKSSLISGRTGKMAALLLGLGLLLRFAMLHGTSNDYSYFLVSWLDMLRGMGGRQALAEPVGDYTMPYTYFLILVSRLGLSSLFVIKVLSIAFDMLAALALAALAAQAGLGAKERTAALCGMLFLPAFFLNGAYWAQCDSIYVFFCLISLLAALRQKSAACWALAGVAFSLKMQTVFLLPVLFALLLAKKIQWRWLPLFPALVLGVNLPSLLAGRPLMSLLGTYSQQAGEYSGLTMNAGTFWAIFPAAAGESFGLAPYVLGAAVLLGFFYWLAPELPAMNSRRAVALAAVLCELEVYLLPAMHERYFYLAEALLILLALLVPKCWWAAALQFAITLDRYEDFLFYDGSGVGRVPWEGAAAGIAVAALVWFFVQNRQAETLPRADKISPQ